MSRSILESFSSTPMIKWTMFQFSQFMLSYLDSIYCQFMALYKISNSYSFRLVANVNSIFTLFIKCFNFDVIVFFLFKIFGLCLIFCGVFCIFGLFNDICISWMTLVPLHLAHKALAAISVAVAYSSIMSCGKTVNLQPWNLGNKAPQKKTGFVWSTSILLHGVLRKR